MLFQFCTFWCVLFKRLLASFILTRVLGWRMAKSYNGYFNYRTNRHVLIYAHTSAYDGIIGYLACVAYDLPVIGVGKKELLDIPIFGYFLNMMDSIIFIDRKKNANTVDYISKELEQRKNFVFTISPEGARSKVTDIHSGFYYVAINTKASIHIARLNYENQTITLDEIVPTAVVQTTTYDKIKTKVLNEMEKEIPYHPDSYHLLHTMPSSTSIININRSWLTYLPLLIVLYIMINAVW